MPTVQGQATEAPCQPTTLTSGVSTPSQSISEHDLHNATGSCPFSTLWRGRVQGDRPPDERKMKP